MHSGSWRKVATFIWRLTSEMISLLETLKFMKKSVIWVNFLAVHIIFMGAMTLEDYVWQFLSFLQSQNTESINEYFKRYLYCVLEHVRHSMTIPPCTGLAQLYRYRRLSPAGLVPVHTPHTWYTRAETLSIYSAIWPQHLAQCQVH